MSGRRVKKSDSRGYRRHVNVRQVLAVVRLEEEEEKKFSAMTQSSQNRAPLCRLIPALLTTMFLYWFCYAALINLSISSNNSICRVSAVTWKCSRSYCGQSSDVIEKSHPFTTEVPLHFTNYLFIYLLKKVKYTMKHATHKRFFTRV